MMADRIGYRLPLWTLIGLVMGRPAVAFANTGIGFAGVYTEVAWVMLLPVILVEAAMFRWLLAISWDRSLHLSGLANVQSTLIGLIASIILMGIYDTSDGFLIKTVVLFWGSSVLIEWVAVLRMRHPEPKPTRTGLFVGTLAGNSVSYILILLALAADLPHRVTLGLAEVTYWLDRFFSSI